MSIPAIAPILKTAFAGIGQFGSTISAALGVGSTALQYQQANSAAKLQAQQNAEANDRARRNMIEDQDAMTRVEMQERAAAAQKINQTQLDAARTAASARVAASAGGVSGLSVDALLGDIYGNEASIRDSVNQNLEATGQQLRAERGSIMNSYENTINTRPSVDRPSLLGATLQAGTSVYGAYKDELKLRGKTGNNIG